MASRFREIEESERRAPRGLLLSAALLVLGNRPRQQALGDIHLIGVRVRNILPTLSCEEGLFLTLTPKLLS